MSEKPYAYVNCYGDSSVGYYGCGIVELTSDQYLIQLDRPDSGWQCPKCGCSAEYNDTLSEKAQDKYYEDEPV